MDPYRPSLLVKRVWRYPTWPESGALLPGAGLVEPASGSRASPDSGGTLQASSKDAGPLLHARPRPSILSRRPFPRATADSVASAAGSETSARLHLHLLLQLPRTGLHL